MLYLQIYIVVDFNFLAKAKEKKKKTNKKGEENSALFENSGV